MTELKTFKDIEEDYKDLLLKGYKENAGVPIGAIIHLSTHLRKEAIKWTKKLKDMPFIQFPEPITKLPDGSGAFTSIMINKEGIEDIIFWIKYFFNITEEELKCQ